MSDKFIYDEVPYPSFTFPQTHPDRLTTLARLYGLDTAKAERSRVLELGCGDGTNLISSAYSLPESNFIGIDLSSHHIAMANETAKHLGLTNIAFRQADVTELLSSELGKFDFIIAHGLYSWVPDFVREAILNVYSECLVENGVGYISYNAYPGCHLRQICFDLLKHSTPEKKGPIERVKAGIANLRMFAEAAQDDSLVQSILALEYDQVLDRTPANIFHDEFSTTNQPFYFHEFASKISEYGFQFLSEADPASTNHAKLNEKGRKLIESVSDDIIRREQYFDFIRFTRFRRTLFCRNTIQLNRDPDPSVLMDLLISSQIKAESENTDFTDASPVKFSDSKGASVTVNHPLTKVVLNYLWSKWSRSVTFDELMAEAAQILGPQGIDIEQRDRTAAFLLDLFKAGMVQLHTYQAPFADLAGAHPRVSDFARWQIENGGQSVTTLTGGNLEVKDIMQRAMIVLLDGTLSREDLESKLGDLLEVPDDQQEEFLSQLPQMIELSLKHLAKSGLLVR